MLAYFLWIRVNVVLFVSMRVFVLILVLDCHVLAA